MTRRERLVQMLAAVFGAGGVSITVHVLAGIPINCCPDWWCIVFWICECPCVRDAAQIIAFR